MSLNKVKSMKSKSLYPTLFCRLGGLLMFKGKIKIKSLNLRVKKLRSEKKAIMKYFHDELAARDDIENRLQLELDYFKELEVESMKEMETMETIHDNTLEKLKERLDNLKDTVECPVCLEIPRKGPVFVCPNGHFVCKRCKAEAKSCPTCRDPMGDGKSLLAVSVIEIIDHKCKFVECEELFAVDKLEAHEKVCKHRMVKCPHRTCTDEVSLSKLLLHLVKSTCCPETAPTIIDTSFKTGQVFLKLQQREFNDMAVRDLNWKVSLFSYKNSKFVICSQKFGDYFHFTTVMVESKEVCAKFKIEMEVHEGNVLCKDSELGIRFRGSPCSIDQEKSKVIHLGLTVHHQVMEELILKDKDLKFTVTFTFSEKRARE